MRRLSSNQWTVTIVGTAVGTVLATWFLALHWSDVKPYFAPVGRWLAEPECVTHGQQLLALVLTLVVVGGGAMLFFWAFLKWRLKITREVVEAIKKQRAAAVAAAPKFDPESFELTPIRCRELLALLRRMESRTTLNQLHSLIIDDGEWFDPDTSNAQVQHDMEDAERAGLVRTERLPEAGAASTYSLTIPDGRDWVLENEAHLKGARHLGMKQKPAGPRYF